MLMNFCFRSCLTDEVWDVNVRTAVNSQVPTIIKITHALWKNTSLCWVYFLLLESLTHLSLLLLMVLASRIATLNYIFFHGSINRRQIRYHIIPRPICAWWPCAASPVSRARLRSYKPSGLELAGPRSRSSSHSELRGQVVWFLETVRITGQVSLLSDLLHFFWNDLHSDDLILFRFKQQHKKFHLKG